MYGGSCTMNQKFKWTLLFSFLNDAYKEYTGLLFVELMARYDHQIVRYDRRNVRYDPRDPWDDSCYDLQLVSFDDTFLVYALGDRC